MGGMQGAVRVCVLGPVAIEHHDVRTVVGSHRAASLLAVLALSGPGWVEERALVERLWDGPAPRTARQQLHTTVSRLRSQFGCIAEESDWLQSRRHGYRLARDVRVDAAEFRQALGVAGSMRSSAPADAARHLAEALELWSGEMADGASHAAGALGAPLVEARASAIRELARHELTTGDAALAVDRLRPLVAEDPYDEESAALVARALAESGHPKEAETLCRETARRLRVELGVSAGPELVTAYRSITRPGHDAVSAISQRSTDTLVSLVIGLVGALPEPTKSQLLAGLHSVNGM